MSDEGMSAEESDKDQAFWLAHDIFSHESDGRLLFRWGDGVHQRTSMGHWNTQQEDALKETIAGRIRFAQAAARREELERVRLRMIDVCKKAGCEYFSLELLDEMHFALLLQEPVEPEAHLVESNSEGA